MQITIKSTRVIKEGEQKQSGKPYKWVAVVAEDSEKGTEYTTFDAGVLKLTPGSVIDIGDPITKSGKLSFKEVVNVVKEATAPAPAPSSAAPPANVHAYKQDIEAMQIKARLQTIERASIEAQTAYNGIISLMAAAIQADRVDDHLRRIVEKAMVWAEKKLDSSTSAAPPAEHPPMSGTPPAPGKLATARAALAKAEDPPAPGEIAPSIVSSALAAQGKEGTAPRFPHIGALLGYCKQQGITRELAMEIWQTDETHLATLDLIKAAEQIDKYLKTPFDK